MMEGRQLEGEPEQSSEARFDIKRKGVLTPDEIRYRRALGWIFFVLIVMALTMPSVGRIIPGGPFLSVSGDLVPIALCLTFLTLCMMLFRRETGAGKLFLLVMMLLATGLLAKILESILLFWFRPYARGVLIGW
jgi:hypothetical protein